MPNVDAIGGERISGDAIRTQNGEPLLCLRCWLGLTVGSHSDGRSVGRQRRQDVAGTHWSGQDAC